VQLILLDAAGVYYREVTVSTETLFKLHRDWLFPQMWFSHAHSAPVLRGRVLR